MPPRKRAAEQARRLARLRPVKPGLPWRLSADEPGCIDQLAALVAGERFFPIVLCSDKKSHGPAPDPDRLARSVGVKALVVHIPADLYSRARRAIGEVAVYNGATRVLLRGAPVHAATAIMCRSEEDIPRIEKRVCQLILGRPSLATSRPITPERDDGLLWAPDASDGSDFRRLVDIAKNGIADKVVIIVTQRNRRDEPRMYPTYRLLAHRYADRAAFIVLDKAAQDRLKAAVGRFNGAWGGALRFIPPAGADLPNKLYFPDSKDAPEAVAAAVEYLINFALGAGADGLGNHATELGNLPLLRPEWIGLPRFVESLCDGYGGRDLDLQQVALTTMRTWILDNRAYLHGQLTSELTASLGEASAERRTELLQFIEAAVTDAGLESGTRGRRTLVWVRTQFARFHFQARQLADALVAIDNAWPTALELCKCDDAEADGDDAHQLADLAILYARVVGYLDDAVYPRFADSALLRAAHARAFVLRALNTGLLVDLCGLANAECNLWVQGSRRGFVGQMSASVRQEALAIAFLKECIRELKLGVDGIDAASPQQALTGLIPAVITAAPTYLRPALERLVKQLQKAAERLRHDKLLSITVEALHDLDNTSTRELSLYLDRFFLEDNFRTRCQFMEDFNRLHTRDARIRRSKKYVATMRRAAHAAKQLSIICSNEALLSASVYWTHKSNMWASEAERLHGFKAASRPARPSTPAKGNSDTVREPNVRQLDSEIADAAVVASHSEFDDANELAFIPMRVPDLTRGQEKKLLKAVQDVQGGIALQHMPQLCHGLLEFGFLSEHALDSDIGLRCQRLLQQVELLAVPVLDTAPSLEFLDCASPHSRFTARALYEALRIAEFSHTEVVPDIAGKLCRHKSLTNACRLAFGDYASSAAIAGGRIKKVLAAERARIDLAHASGRSDDVDASIDAACESIGVVVEDSVSSSILFDVLSMTSNWLRKQAGWLAKNGYERSAFLAAMRSRGVRSQILERVPALSYEFEMTELNIAEPIVDNQQNWLKIIDERLCAGPAASSVTPPISWATEDLIHTADEIFVQFGKFGNEVWCLVSGNCLGQHQYQAIPLNVTLNDVHELAETLWHDIPRTGASSAAGSQDTLRLLAQLYDAYLSPISGWLADCAAIKIMSHGQLTSLPFHAARSNGQFLIERVKVTYVTRIERDHELTNDPVVICGWDPSIAARDEAHAVRDILRRSNKPVVYADNAKTGMQTILSVSGRASAVHIAAHGVFYKWPKSWDSVLRMTEKQAVTARQWLYRGLQADMVFANACNVGRTAPKFGDVNGFSLAFQARGARTIVAALGLIPPEAAHEFAVRFYEAIGTGDSLAAYQHACVASIAAGQPIAGWAPYVHTGIPWSTPTEARTSGAPRSL